MLSNFFCINLPYGIASNEKGQWMSFNREHMPLGVNDYPNKHTYNLHATMTPPIHTSYEDLSEDLLFALADGMEELVLRCKGKIVKVFFYDEVTTPLADPKNWDRYIKKIETISQLKIK